MSPDGLKRVSLVRTTLATMIFSRTIILIISAVLFIAAGRMFVFAADDSRPSVGGVKFTVESNDVVLGWPSDPRECFVLLWRSNATYQSPWIVLTNQLRAAQREGTTCFTDVDALSRSPAVRRGTNLDGFYRVFVIPDFWFNMNGTTLCGGPKSVGEDFLPFYYGGTETDILQPWVALYVDGADQKTGSGQGFKTDSERVNFGTMEKPRWLYTSGLWFRHDRLANGPHALQLISQFQLNYSIGPYTQTLTVSNEPVQLLTTNQITFTNWDDLIWNNTNCTFKAQSAEPRVNWRIKVYSAAGRLLIEKTGRTTDGDIRWTWDLRDQSGELHDNSDVDHVFFPNITVWPLNKPEDEGKDMVVDNAWWNQRLGREFVRIYSPFNGRPVSTGQAAATGQQAPVRPLDLSNVQAKPTSP